MHTRDAIGDRVHLVLACVCVACLVGPVSVVEFAAIPLVLFFLIRVLNTFPIWVHGFGQPVMLAAIVLAAWMGLGLLWSDDPRQGAESLASLRWVALVGFVFPVIERRGALIAALVVGLLLGNAAQLVAAMDGFGIGWLSDSLVRAKGRVSGWWDPAVGGSVLAAAVGLHTPPAMWGRGRERAVGVVLLLVTLAALLATGTRGGWIAGAGVLTIGSVAAFVRSGNGWRRAAVGIVVVLVGVAAAWTLVGEQVSARIDEARVELSEAARGEYTSWTGARVSMMRGAIEAGVSEPILGVGTGGFKGVMGETALTLDDAAHAHNTALHVFAENGLPGLALLVLVTLAALRGAHAQGAARDGAYHQGPLWALIGLILVSAFDAVIINTQTAALLGVLVALSPVYSPGMSSPGPGSSGTRERKRTGA